MGYVKRKTARKEHETPWRVWFRHFIELGYSQSHTAQLAELPCITIIKWIQKRASDWRIGKQRPGRPPIIPDIKVEEIIKWIIGYFDWWALPLQEIAQIYGIKACNNTILAAFAHHGYYHHMPDYKPFLSEATKLKRYTFSIANWDWPKEY
jgi:transposase